VWTAIDSVCDMDPANGPTLPPHTEEEHRCDSSASLSPSQNGDRYGSAKPETLNDRLDQMQAEIRDTHRMMRELSALVHRQLQVRLAGANALPAFC
jgi:phage-related protein